MILPDVLRAAAQHYGGCTAVRDDEGDLTWAETADRVARTAGVLAQHGLQPDERFGVIKLNGFRTAELFWAGYWMGCVPVPVNWRLAPGEMADILDDAGVKFVIVDAAFAAMLGEPPLDKWAAGALRHGPPDGDGPYPNIETALADAAPVAPHASGENDDALILYTGGTTGRSKGVRLSHRNIVANAGQNGYALGIRYGDVWVHAAPMFHSADLIGNSPTLMGGGHVYLPQFSGANFLAAVERHRPTATVLPPTMLRMVMDDAAFKQSDTSSLRLIYYGSSPMAEGWIRDAMAKFPGAQICQGYGLTETAPILTVLDDASHRAAIESGDPTRLRSAGRPVPEVWLRIADQDGNETAPGEGGEVLARGPNVMNGYHNLPDETAAALQDGWFHTGDVGYLDDEGYLYLLDRKKDMVITGGENVYTTEVEAALYKHPGVLEAAVVGVPDDKTGEALFAVVVVKDGEQLDEQAMIAHCREHIGGYKIPRRYDFIDAMPKNAMGKILKNELRRTYGVRR